MARPAVSVKLGMPRWTAWVRRAVIWSIWASLAFGAGEADLQSLGLAVPAVGFGFGDAGEQVVVDLLQPGPGGRVRAQQRAAQAAVFVDAGGVVGAAAVADGDFAVFEVADELGPFLVGGGAVFLAGAQRAAAGDEGPVAVDHLFGVDGLVAHGGVDVAVAGDELGDVRWHAVHDRVGDEQPAEIVEGVAQGAPGGVVDADRGQRVVEVGAQRPFGHRAVLQPSAPLEQQRQGWVVDAFVLVVGDHQRHVGLVAADAGDDGGQRVGQFR